jgi:arylsulfatase
MYIKAGRLHYNYNFLDGEHHHLVSKPLPRGKVDLMFTFELDRSKLEPGKLMPWPGTGALYVNGEKQDEVYFPTTHISTYSLAETFDVGIDTGTQVDPDYQGNPFEFTGELDRVVITLTD